MRLAGPWLIMAAALAWVGGCGEALLPPEEEDEKDAPASVTVTPSSMSVAAEDTVIVTATVYDASHRMLDRDVTWSSSDPTMATVVSFGPAQAGRDSAAVIGAKPGSVTITATSGTASGTSTVAVGPPRAVPGIVSNPVTRVSAASGSAALTSAEGEFVYVSLPPDSFPDGDVAVLRHLRSGISVNAPMVDGGLDPVPVAAMAGDALELEIRLSGGAPPRTLELIVPELRKPRVVRIWPPHKKRDVVLNARPVIIFSEPVAGGTLSPSSVQLFRGETPIAGTVKVLEGTGVMAAFVPAAPLDANTEYRLVVTDAVQDQDGDALEAGSVDFTTGTSSTGPPVSLRLSVVDTLYTLIGETYQLTATVLDAAGNVLIDQPVVWSTSDPSGLSVSPSGLLGMLQEGGYTVTAALNGLTAYVLVRVSNPLPPASVEVAPPTATVAAGDTIFLAATVRDAAGRVLESWSVRWTSSDPAMAAVRPWDGRVIGGAPGDVTITATSGTASGTANVTVGPPVPVASVTVVPEAAVILPRETVQLTATLRDATGRVIGGRSITWTSDNEAVAWVGSGGKVLGVNEGSAAVTATSEGASDATAITVSLIEFASVTAGGSGWFSCGLATTGPAYCWGQNFAGQLGDGSYNSSLFPEAVSGGLAFTALSAGGYHACGVTTSGAAYCWGANWVGQLGDGSGSDRSSIPVAVFGGVTFATLSAATDHTCGLATSGAAYCWGDGNYGRLGTGSINSSSVPVPVSGGLTFTALTAAGHTLHTCGVTTGGAAYCWGLNDFGQLGDGSGGSPESFSSVPTAVTGELTFTAVSAGQSHTCGLATSGAAHCWGEGYYGQLGTGSDNSTLVPVAVTGRLTFTALSAGYDHTCGLATGGSAYCWGDNEYGQLGTGSNNASAVPVAVTGGLTFTALSAGEAYTCGLATDGAAYCWGSNNGGRLGDDGTDGLVGSLVPVKVAGQR